MRVAVSLISALLIAGCSANEVRETGASEQFTVPENYQETYRRIKRWGEECLSVGFGYNFDGQLFTDIKKAEVRWINDAMIGRIYYFVVDIEAADDRSTRVTIKRSGIIVQRISRQVEAAARGASGCPSG